MGLFETLRRAGIAKIDTTPVTTITASPLVTDLARSLYPPKDEFDTSYDINCALRSLVDAGLAEFGPNNQIVLTQEGLKYKPAHYMGG